MKRFRYLLSRLGKMNYRALFDAVDQVHQKTGRNRLRIFLDMAWCGWCYGAGYMDYCLFELYRLNRRQRNTYLTRGRNNTLIRQYNHGEYFHIFDHKGEFYRNFSDFLHRDWLLLSAVDDAALEEFLRKHPTFIAKPVDGSCGRGVCKATRAEIPQFPENTLLEEVISQHSALNGLYPDSVNTVRVVTIFKDGVAHVICAYLRIGNHGNAVDNFNHGGMVAPVDLDTGTVTAPAVDKKKNVYARHPMTGCQIQGFQLPNWSEAMALARQAAARIPQMGYIGWDVAFSVDGPLIVEGNNFPGHDIYQLPAHTPDGIGIWDKFQV